MVFRVNFRSCQRRDKELSWLRETDAARLPGWSAGPRADDYSCPGHPFARFSRNFLHPHPRTSDMKNRRFVCSNVLALILPAILGLSCLKRDWSVCTPKDHCQSGYICTADWHCVLPGDGGIDGIVAVDSHAPTDAAGRGERDWSVCSPPAEMCQPGFACTADFRCVPIAGSGSDSAAGADGRAADQLPLDAVATEAAVAIDAAQPSDLSSPDAPSTLDVSLTFDVPSTSDSQMRIDLAPPNIGSGGAGGSGSVSSGGNGGNGSGGSGSGGVSSGGSGSGGLQGTGGSGGVSSGGNGGNGSGGSGSGGVSSGGSGSGGLQGTGGSLPCGVVCPDPTTGSATGHGLCAGTTCQVQCNSGYHLCGTSACYGNSDSQHCGSSCQLCSAPTGGTATCTNDTCVMSCGTQTLCGTACTNTDTDAQNCGSCGHSCLGGTCVTGQCRPAAVVSNPGSNPKVIGLVDSSAGSYLYYMVGAPNGGQSTNTYRVNKTGSGIIGTLVDTGANFETHIAVMSNRLFSRGMGPITMCDVSSCASSKVALLGTGALSSFKSPAPQYFAQQDNPTDPQVTMTFTWYTTSNVAVQTYKEQSLAATTSYMPFFAFSDSVYWIRLIYDASSNLTDATLYLASTANPSATRLTGNMASSSFSIIDVNAQSVLLSGSSALYRVPLPSGLPTTLPGLVTQVSGYLQAATEDQNGVYWVESDGTVYSCSATSCASTKKVLAAGQSLSGTLYQDGTALYWANSTPSQVVRLAK
jgi:hypothetical protein